MEIKLNKKHTDKNKISYSFFLAGLIWNEYIDKQNIEGNYIGIISKFSRGEKSEMIF